MQYFLFYHSTYGVKWIELLNYLNLNLNSRLYNTGRQNISIFVYWNIFIETFDSSKIQQMHPMQRLKCWMLWSKPKRKMLLIYSLVLCICAKKKRSIYFLRIMNWIKRTVMFTVIYWSKLIMLNFRYLVTDVDW